MFRVASTDVRYGLVDPGTVDRLAFAGRQVRIDRPGGVEALPSRSDFSFTPLPS